MVTVSGYSKEIGTIKLIPIATVATTYDDRDSGASYLLIIHNALYFGPRLDETVLTPNQMRDHGLQVDDVPRQYDRNSRHRITIPDPLFHIPLELRGVMSGFTTRKPTEEEIDQLPRIELTSRARWKPYSTMHEERESQVAKVRYTSNTQNDEEYMEHNRIRQVSAVCSYQPVSSCPTELLKTLGDRLVATVTVAPDDIVGDGIDGASDIEVYITTGERRAVSVMTSVERRSTITPEILARRWGIGLSTAARTLQVTTQRGLRNVIAPGERKVRQRLNHLRYPVLKGEYYVDTMLPTSKSLRGYTTAQVFTNGRGYDRFYPMTKRKEADDALEAFISDAGIPQTLISDNAWELMGGNSKNICNKYAIKQKQIVPHSPWQNRAESSIREIKAGVRKTLRRSGAPSRLWCYCGQWITAIRRLTALNIP